MSKAKIGEMTMETGNSILGGQHPPVVRRGAVLADQGELPAGCIIGRDGDGKIIPAAAAGDAVGVLIETLDTTTQTSGNYVPHGSVVEKNLKTTDGADGFMAADLAWLAALEDIGIYPE